MDHNVYFLFYFTLYNNYASRVFNQNNNLNIYIYIVTKYTQIQGILTFENE